MNKKCVWSSMGDFEEGWYWYKSPTLGWCPCQYVKILGGFRTWNDRGIVNFRDGEVLYKIEGITLDRLCKNCHHWSGSKLNGNLLMRICECPKMEFGYGPYYDKDEEILSIDSVLIEYDEGWGWFTGPEFGCIHFVEKQ